MNTFQRFLISRNFAFLAVFMVFFCLFAVIILDADHPLYLFALGCGVALFLMQRYRKTLLKRL
ncbi:MAG TPA: hypothetical protein VLZ28_07530 [Daejeonella sp.]|nr:hypothetical protein [Daejeonella sp.]